MKIAVDLRSLQTGFLSGVENYTLNVLERLLAIDRENQYTLFYNAFRPTTAEHLHFVNSKVVKKRVPNRILNLSLRFLSWPKFEKYIGDFDCLFLPNFNQFAIGSESKLALTVHDLSPFITPEFYNAKRRLWHRTLNVQKTLRRANVIFAVSEYTKHDLVEKFGVTAEKVVVTHLGVDHTVFRPDLSESRMREVRNIYGLPGEFVLYLGTVEPRKNVEGIIEAFNRLESGTALVIAGRPGWKYDAVFKAIEHSPKRRQIHVLGFVDEADKPYLMKLAKVFAFPSFYEGFGLPVLEAMSVGTPVVTSQLTSIPEVTGSSALLVNPHNTDDLANALDELIKNDLLRKQLTEKALVRAQEFTWAKTAERVYQAFQNLK